MQALILSADTSPASQDYYGLYTIPLTMPMVLSRALIDIDIDIDIYIYIYISAHLLITIDNIYLS